ncbi:MAG: hypothetical protein R2861_10760 [Desulfobacterales bacterium]
MMISIWDCFSALWHPAHLRAGFFVFGFQAQVAVDAVSWATAWKERGFGVFFLPNGSTGTFFAVRHRIVFSRSLDHIHGDICRNRQSFSFSLGCWLV